MKPDLRKTDWVNRCYFDPESSNFQIESFWVKANDPNSRRAIWLRLTLFSNPEERNGETWAMLFDGDRGEHLALKEVFDVGRVGVDPERPGVGIGECGIDGRNSWGLVQREGIAVSWRLRFEDLAPAYAHYPGALFYTNRIFPKKKLTAPHVAARIHGEVEIWRGEGEAERWVIDGWPGMQGHVWGTRHIERYVWVHCNAFDDFGPDSWLDVGSAQVRLGPILTSPMTVGRLVLDGTTYRFDTVRHLRSHDSDFGPGRWAFRLTGPDGDLAGTVRAPRNDIVGLTYGNPSGKTAYCLNSKIAQFDAELLPRHGDSRKLLSSRAALEVTQLDPNHGMRLYL